MQVITHTLKAPISITAIEAAFINPALQRPDDSEGLYGPLLLLTEEREALSI